ncbi:MAG TPA: DUF2203 domain-containing protein [Planctomycetota bacterium]|nr:DUF2203 domain-containing protein [Planctomycetota bacterium]
MPRDTYKPKKVFSLKEANQTLPLVSRIIQDIVRVNDQLAEAHDLVRRLVDEGAATRAAEAEDHLEDLSFEAAAFVEELEAVGCHCKDPAVGLVDFPARLNNRIVFLCWRMGEPEITFWHEVDSGFAGRKPVAATGLSQ